MLTLSDFDYDLPSELIASHPLENRDASRMLVVVPANEKFSSVGGVPRSGEVVRACEVGANIDEFSNHPDTSCHPSNGGELGAVRYTVNYKTLPFNPKLTERARELRKSGSLPEALLWKEIKGKKLNGLDFDRQKIIGNYIVDFFCASKFLVIEIDDKTHDFKNEYDKKRDEYLKSLNLTVIHIAASDVLKNPGAVFDWLSNHPDTSCHPSNGGEQLSSCSEQKFPSMEGCPTGGVVNIYDKHIRDFVDYLRPGDVVVFNNSRVIPARFMADGKHEITLHTSVNDKVWWGLCKKFNKIPDGAILTLDDGTQIKVLSHDDNSGLKLEFLCDNVFAVLDKVGKMPLPPYMKREAELFDRDRYQTVYACPLGSMAAPTAGLHFTPELLDAIRARGAQIVNITLHVGAGTWLPVKTEDLSKHKMHSEWGCITPEQAAVINAAERVIAVGTTSMRLLESAAMCNSDISQYRRVAPFCATTDIFITPGYKFRAVDVLLTNFHLPKSTLFMLVSAFAGLSEMQRAYSHAVADKYRFFSYGDCCLLFKKEN